MALPLRRADLHERHRRDPGLCARRERAGEARAARAATACCARSRGWASGSSNLWRRFRHSAGHREAPVEELAAVDGVGLARARDIKEGLAACASSTCWSGTGDVQRR